METNTGTPESMELTKKHWKTPVLHTRGVEETLGGATDGATEDSDYNPSAVS